MAADKGDATAMERLGMYYAEGFGVAQNYAKAREWLEKAANKGDTDAMLKLGLLYTRSQDWAKARQWFKKGADNGNERAMVSIGMLYESGQGVAQNFAEARGWYEKAADKGESTATGHLDQLPISEAAGAGRYGEALQLQEAHTAEVEAVETKYHGKPGEGTAQELNDVAWYALFAKDYTKALAAADRAHALFRDNLGFETNRAHALMFVGHDEEARRVYLAHKGEPRSGVDNKLWEQAIADDFAEFRKAGLTHPMMADIEKELGISR
jgi:tetratricopeptide (TPR) repeat protein